MRVVIGRPILDTSIIGGETRLWKLSLGLLAIARLRCALLRKKTLAETSADDRPDLIRLRFKLVFCFGGQPRIAATSNWRPVVLVVVGDSVLVWLSDPV